jgi:hypothetical protein
MEKETSKCILCQDPIPWYRSFCDFHLSLLEKEYRLNSNKAWDLQNLSQHEIKVVENIY